jgi:hypothetical protein
MKPILTIAAALAVLPSIVHAQLNQLQASYDFLVKERSAGGALLNFTNGQANYLLPSSFYDTADYWAQHVCEGAQVETAKAKCAVTDTYSGSNFQLTPEATPSGQLQVERVNAHNSANIYDAATWQIAVMLGYVKGKMKYASPTSAYALASGLTEFLHQSGTAPLIEGGAPGTKRATTSNRAFVYNGTVIKNGVQAYAFRTMAPEWLARDPFMGSSYASLVTAKSLPFFNSDYEEGKISWTDWKPITGENAWAFLIGPLQTAHLHYIVFRGDEFIPFKDLAVQNALDVLPTFAAMQSSVGGVYYAPEGSVGNQGDALVNPHEVSVENNLSLFAGLQILRTTLQTELAVEATLTDGEKTKIKDALQRIDVMINGGEIAPFPPDGKDQKASKSQRPSKPRLTKGLLSFFKDAAWQDGRFVQGGLADDPTQKQNWVPTTAPLAVDVQTWAISALGAKQIDTWFGAGAAYQLWQNVKAWGGYGVENTLWGVGYSNQDGNGIDENRAYKAGVMSAEWTAGAIMAVRNMLTLYSAEDPSLETYAITQPYVLSLKQDEEAMLRAMTNLRIDQYAAADFPGEPVNFDKLVSTQKTKPYLYASRRHYIPFGWYANPLPSTASTAWVIMVANNYDPFGIGGAPN